MNNIINGTIDENRVLTFETASLYEGEENSSVLKIDAGVWEDDGVDSYTLAFETEPYSEKFISNVITDSTCTPAYISDGFIFCPVTSAMTASGRLGIQVRAHRIDENGNPVTEKTAVSYLTLAPSINTFGPLPGENDVLIAEIGKIKQRMHIFEQALTVIPEASNISVGGMMLDGMSPIKLVNKAARVNWDGIDFDYMCASLVAKLLFDSSETTPVYFPGTREGAQELIETITDDLEDGDTSVCMVIVPADATHTACLAVIFMGENGPVIRNCRGSSLLGLLRNGVNGY